MVAFAVMANGFRPKHMIDCEVCEGSGSNPCSSGSKCPRCLGPGYYDPRYPPSNRIVVGGPPPLSRHASEREVAAHGHAVVQRADEERRIARPAGSGTSDPTHDFAAFAVAASGDLPDEIERFRPYPWQLRFWREVEEGAAPKIIMYRGTRDLVSLRRKR